MLDLSVELIDELFLWPELAAVLAVRLDVGRRAEDDVSGLVGGLLSPLPGTLREFDKGFDLGVGAGVDAMALLVAFESRFGGIPFLGGDLKGFFDGPSEVLTD